MEEDKNDLSDRPAKASYSGKSSGIMKYSGMAMQMLGTILVFTYGGYKLDEWQQNKVPVWTLVLSLTSIAASLYLLIRGISKTGK
ncbi:AtpZ/AtpI family protein [Dyadobacter psychrotolerans]|uniref:AtpZ/AtpI family protein n=1 Tax=Dyadobacter psychrotolerans TaxID=2541721 RepID=A0A4R5DVV9_9BACT|nr:AtpZ/AtpI family protein [Dyadobacter psychrotolerans]TDE16281.1 AtpZ/AtpI family protein [Dyadobacter psychrotolerans]